MKLRSLARRAATVSVACLAYGAVAFPATASTPPTNPNGADNASDTTATTMPAAPPADPSVSGQIEESWALTPLESGDPDAAGNRSEFAYDAEPGTVIKDGVTVVNLGNVAEDFQVYSTDAFNTGQGEFDLLAGNEPPTDVGTWVDILQPRVTLQPGQQANIPITITVPLDARPGDHAGAIVASSPTTGDDGAGNTVQLDRRTGSRLYIRVNGPLTAELAVTAVDSDYDTSINPLGGTAHVTYTVENRGNTRLGGTATVSVAGPLGVAETKLELADIPELLPGAKITREADVDGVPELFYGLATVRVTPNGGGLASKASQASDASFVPPVPALLVLLALVIAALAWRHLRRRRADGDEAGTDQEPAPDHELEHQPA